MLAELVRRDGASLYVEVGLPPPPDLDLLDLPLVQPAWPTRGIGLAIALPRRRYRRRPWAVGQTPVYDEVA